MLKSRMESGLRQISVDGLPRMQEVLNSVSSTANKNNVTLMTFGLADFLERTPKAQPMTERINKQNFIKIKNLCSVKDKVRRMKRQMQAGKQYLQRTLSDKTQLSKIYKEGQRVNNKR